MNGPCVLFFLGAQSVDVGGLILLEVWRSSRQVWSCVGFSRLVDLVCRVVVEIVCASPSFWGFTEQMAEPLRSTDGRLTEEEGKDGTEFHSDQSSGVSVESKVEGKMRSHLVLSRPSKRMVWEGKKNIRSEFRWLGFHCELVVFSTSFRFWIFYWISCSVQTTAITQLWCRNSKVDLRTLGTAWRARRAQRKKTRIPNLATWDRQQGVLIVLDPILKLKGNSMEGRQ